METMRWKAVIFDLFGTLVKGADQVNHTSYLDQSISMLGADADQFRKCWAGKEMIDLRATGKLASPCEILSEACRRCNLSPSEQALQAAIDLRRQAFETWLEPRSDAHQVCWSLKKQGIKLALMSDCTADVPDLWPSLSFSKLFDAVLFSCILGIRKPDQRFYAIACEKIEVQPEHCLYVGDGASRELSGATQAGMQAVLIAATDHQDEVLPREDAHVWTGPRIHSLTEVLNIIRPGQITHSH